ncbi:MAG: hypothetical protein ACYTGC_17220, partial [Planctomycetota bacterium]
MYKSTLPVHVGFVLAALLLAASPAIAQDDLPEASTVLDAFVEATGGRAAYERIENRVAHVRLVHVGMGFEDSLVEYAARPND